MSKFHNNISREDMPRISTESRAAEKAAEANRGIMELKSDILRLKILNMAMLEILKEQGVDPELINAKIEEIVERPETFMPSAKESKPCPKCGRTIMDNGSLPLVGTCLYCGTTVKFPPLIKTGEVDTDTEQNPELNSVPDGFQDIYKDNYRNI